MIDTIDPSTLSLDDIREKILNTLLVVIATLASLALAASLFRIVDMGWQYVMAFHAGAYAIALLIAIFRRKLRYKFKASSLVIFSFLVGCVGIVNMGIIGSGILFMFFSVAFATVFFDLRTGAIVIAASFIQLIIMTFIVGQGWISYDFDLEATAVSVPSWISKISAFILFSSFLITTVGALIRHLVESGEVLKERTMELQRTNEDLLEKMAEIRKTREHLTQSEHNYWEIFNASSDAIFIHDGETGEILDVNTAMLNMYGYEREEVLGVQAGGF